jgi:penicillin-binding protein 2
MRRRRDKEINPEDIFLDSSNLPEFASGRLEGKLEKPLSEGSHFVLLCGAAILFLILLVKAVSVGVFDGAVYAAQSEKNRLRPEVIFAKRGAIVDRNGEPLAENIPGAEGYPVRSYGAPGFAHLLGYVSYPQKDRSGNYFATEIEGLAGVERAFNDRLKGENGTLLIEENALGDLQSSGTVVEPVEGETLMLSVDARVQRAFHDAIKDLADKIPYKGGAGIMMDVETGEVIALASYPEYDPNILSSGGPDEIINGYATDARDPYLDRPVSGLYTPGSIVKPLIAAGALSDGVISAEKQIVSTGQLVVPNPYNPDLPSVFRDWKAHGATDMRRAIAVSSDVYFYTLGGGFGDQKGLGIERLDYWYKAFGLDALTGIELAGEGSGFLPTPAWKEATYDDPWRLGDTYNTSIGQYAVQITPLEAVRMTAAIANGGKLLRPTVLTGAPIEGESIVISQEALAVAREGMRMSVTEGTAAGLGSYPYAKAAGKTGTAQLGVDNEWYNSWVIGFFPYDKPKYAFAVVMERAPAGTATGGVYVMARVFETMRNSAPEYFGLEK